MVITGIQRKKGGSKEIQVQIAKPQLGRAVVAHREDLQFFHYDKILNV